MQVRGKEGGVGEQRYGLASTIEEGQAHPELVMSAGGSENILLLTQLACF